MSQPEWMKKYQEIGQKEEEEVTGIGEDGFVKTVSPTRRQSNSAHGGASSGDDGTDDDDAAAMFRAAAPVPYDKSNNSREPPNEASSSVDISSVNTDEVATNNSSYEDTTSGENEQASSGVLTAPTGNKEEDFGDSWVPDRDKVNARGSINTRSSSDIDSEAAAADPNRESFNPQESFITEEVYVDEDGNEILVDENGDEIQFDENGKEVQIGDEIQEEEILLDENGDEIVYDERKALPARTAPVYDIEDQKRILGSGKKGNRSRMSWCIPVLVFAMIVASILLVIFLVVYNEDRDNFGTAPTMAPTPTNYLEQDPGIGGIDAAATTEFDPIQNGCSLVSQQPSILDQCNCVGNVNIVADDVRARWESLEQNFIPDIYPEWDKPINSCSPENQALLWLSSGMNNGGEISNELRLQRYILAIVYYEQGGTKWSRSANWLSEKNACEWEGVECNENMNVRILNLDQNQVTGQLSDAPTLLNAIEAYFATNNNLVGSIPDAYFSDNSLRFLDFAGNALSGGFTSNISEDTKLQSINFAFNKMNGSIPREISDIAGLEILNIESNKFSGELPRSLFDLPLTELSVGGNEFSGPVPVDLQDVSTLTSLSLGPNLFTGDLPTSLSELTALKKLSIVGIPDITGRLPATYGLSLTGLVELSITGTSVEGDIPDQYAMMTKLETLQLSNNSIRGKIPSSLSLLTNLESLSLNGNALTGTIPSGMGVLSSIQELRFDSNSIIGTIPDEFENLKKIKTLTFDDNFMNGRVPNGVCDLRDAALNKFVVDCPTLIGESQVVDGIICSIPDCCTECL